ncbi:glycosyltransferase family 2 protein [Nocardioides salsibiostraticola]
MSGTVCYEGVTVVVPAYNEAETVGTTVTSLRDWFSHVVVVDDGSSDDTLDVAQSAGAVVVRHPFNLGQGAALQTGFAYALRDPRSQRVLTFDADGQHRVSDGVTMVDLSMRTEVDVVLGSRFLGTALHMSSTRRLVLRAGVRFTRWSTRLDVSDAHNGMRVLSRRALEVIEITLNDMAHASQLLSLIAEHELSYAESPVTIDYSDYSRAGGQSNLNALNILFDIASHRLRKSKR